MKPEFWLEAWQQGRRGFHVGEPNARLKAHAHVFAPAGRILVPLCGASHDLRWLASEGHKVVGVELSPLAVEELADREKLAPRGHRGPFTVFGNDDITVLLGDFFELTRGHTGPITGIWDRAALVAMHPAQRAAYLEVHRGVMAPDAVLLLNTLSYDQTKVEGPPWSVAELSVKALWPGLTRLVREDMPAHARFQDAGVETLTSWVFSGKG